MTRKISSFIFIGLIFTLAVWMSDKNSVITVDWARLCQPLFHSGSDAAGIGFCGSS